MPYTPNKPQPTDQLSVSQGDLLGDIQELQAFCNQDHSLLNSVDVGKHKQATFPQIIAPLVAPTTSATECALYSAASVINAANTALFFRPKSNGTAKEFTEYKHTGAYADAVGSGFTQLPSGLIMKWGWGLVPKLAVPTTLTFDATIPYTLPPFTITLGPFYGGGNHNTNISIKSFTNVDVVLRNNDGSTDFYVYYFAIGI